MLLLLHGEPFWSYSFHDLVPLLTARGHRVIVIDFVGFGRSDKYIDWKAYTLEMHKATVVQLVQHLNLDKTNTNLTLVGVDWGFLAGSNVMKDNPEMFQRLVILNTNSLPDGDTNRKRFPNTILFNKFLIYNAPFQAFRAYMNIMRNSVPLQLLFYIMNPAYTFQDLKGLTAPYNRIKEDRGGIISWPLMLPGKNNVP